MMCFAGCSIEEVVSAMGLQLNDLFVDGGNRKTKENRITSTVSATYNYHDEHGVLLYQVERLEPKGFRQRRPSATWGQSGVPDWIYNMDGVRRVLYRLPELMAADPKRIVLVVEGEKDVETLTAKGFVATCSVGGAGRWLPEYAKILTGRMVVCLCDNDEPGRKHMADVWTSLDQRPLVVNFPCVDKGYDASRYFQGGGTTEGLKNLIRIHAAFVSASSYATLDAIEARLKK